MDSYYQIIKQMRRQEELKTFLDPEEAERHFDRQFQQKNKIEQLKTSVFKNFTIKKSKSVYHPIRALYLSSQKPTKKVEEDFRQQLGTSQKTSLPIPAVTTIKFRSKQLSRSSSHRMISPVKNIPMSTFSPRKTVGSLRNTFQIEQKIREIQLQEVKLKRSLSTKVRSLQQRDSQTILRKNSLFLVNCLKTRYRETMKKAQVGQSVNVANMRLGSLKELNGGVTQYQQRFQYMQQARQRMLITREMDMQSKLSKISPLLPQPW